MGIRIKHVVVVSSIFAAVGFVYVIGFAEMDESRSPRAGAIDARASASRMVQNVRGYLASGQNESARRASDELMLAYPLDPRTWLNRAYAYRAGGTSGGGTRDEVEARTSWSQLFNMVDEEGIESQGVNRRLSSLYIRGWALRGLGRAAESRADFTRVAMLYESSLGVDSGAAVGEDFGKDLGAATAYNMACYWAMAGDGERAMAYWEAAVVGGYIAASGDSGWWRVDPDLELLHGDGRFMGVVDEWTESREGGDGDGADGGETP